jgi:hypothetical protein
MSSARPMASATSRISRSTAQQRSSSSAPTTSQINVSTNSRLINPATSSAAISKTSNSTAQTISSLVPAADEEPIKELRRLFGRVYTKWSRREQIDEGTLAAISTLEVSEEDFLALTGNREYSKYIALINYRLRFDEIPLRPHGQVISYIVDHLSNVFQTRSQAHVLFGASDNGMASSFSANDGRYTPICRYHQASGCLVRHSPQSTSQSSASLAEIPPNWGPVSERCH